MIPTPPTPKHDDVESASLRLAFLKENSRYRKFIEENRDRILTAYREWRSAVLEGRAPKIPSVNRFGKEISQEDAFRGFMAGGAIIPFDGGPVIKIPNPWPITEVHVWFHKRLEKDFGIVNPPFDVSMRAADGRREVLTPEESLDLLDPMKDIESEPKERREAALRIMFSARGIRQVVHNDEAAMFRRQVPYFCTQQTINNDKEDWEVSEEASISVFELEQREKQQRRLDLLSDEDLKKWVSPWFKGKLSPFPLSALLPHERLLVVDLRKKKSELLEEFGTFFDRVKYHRKNTRDSEWTKVYNLWKPDTTRTRDEAWRHLEVWRLRRQVPKPSFPEIARGLHITPAATKKSFYRAYEMIYGEPFDLKAWEKDRAEKPSKTCANCPQREGCKDPCPEIFEEKTSNPDFIPGDADVSETLEGHTGSRADAYAYNEWLTRKEENESR